MAENKAPTWTYGLTINLASNFIAFVVGGIVTYLTREGSGWVKPLLFGGAAWLITFCSILAFRISRSLPLRVKPTDMDNIEGRIRDWLDKFNLTVQRLDTDGAFFLFIVTTSGGKKVSISRTKGQFSDYIEATGLIAAGAEEKTALAALTEDELYATRLAIQLELSRAVMGYKSGKDILEEITIFKRRPISPSMGEEDIFNLIWDVEAMLGSIFTIGLMAVQRNKITTVRQSRANEA